MSENWPKNGDFFWFVLLDGTICDSEYLAHEETCERIRSFGNMFRTREEAEEASERIQNLLTTGSDCLKSRIADLESAIRRCCRNCWANDATDLSGADQSHRVDAPLELRKRAMCGF